MREHLRQTFVFRPTKESRKTVASVGGSDYMLVGNEAARFECRVGTLGTVCV